MCRDAPALLIPPCLPRLQAACSPPALSICCAPACHASESLTAGQGRGETTKPTSKRCLSQGGRCGRN
eukprot:8597266-Pyramimonas_sp.AAC.1